MICGKRPSSFSHPTHKKIKIAIFSRLKWNQICWRTKMSKYQIVIIKFFCDKDVPISNTATVSKFCLSQKCGTVPKRICNDNRLCWDIWHWCDIITYFQIVWPRISLKRHQLSKLASGVEKNDIVNVPNQLGGHLNFNVVHVFWR